MWEQIDNLFTHFQAPELLNCHVLGACGMKVGWVVDTIKIYRNSIIIRANQTPLKGQVAIITIKYIFLSFEGVLDVPTLMYAEDRFFNVAITFSESFFKLYRNHNLRAEDMLSVTAAHD